ncbi:hypothetical protein [Empedobacter sedimenti]|uniref:hypothetical protein n=1 Tax=Empedobacter sedimenti TaxID=3042610 RepID=UPI0024A62900|nr:hypothetical protein [Empedobacter sedimenti]
MDWTQIFVTILGYLLGAGGLVFWFLERRKFNAEVSAVLESVQASKIDNDVKLSNHYKDILDDLKQRYEDRYQEYEALMQSKEKILKEEISMLNRKIKMLKTENIELRKRIAELEKQTKHANQSPT